jgi:L-malate glycosyltransferase
MKVLYVNHTAQVSGAEEALCDLLAALPNDVEPVVAAPVGPLEDRVSALGIEHVEIPATDGSLRPHPVHTPRAIGELARAGIAVKRVAARVGADVVHANTVRAGLAAALARSLGAPPPVVSVHDCLPSSLSASLTRETIGAGAAVVIANSRHTAERFATRASSPDMRVVNYGIDEKRFDPSRIDRADARRSLGLAEDDSGLAVVGQLTPWKGQDHAIRLLAELAPEHPDARLVLAGSVKFASAATRFDNPAYVRELHELTDSLGLGDRVLFVGERNDVPSVLRAVDVALVPSWEEPFGRAVIEALAMGVPVVATDVGGPREVIAEGEGGYVLPPRDLGRWKDAVGTLLADPELRSEVGHRGQALVHRAFPMRRYVQGVLDAYATTLAGRPPETA